MLNVMLASHGFFRGGYYGGSIGNLLAYWEQIGFFSYVLPFLLIFALVYGILTRTQIFKDNRAVNGILALTVGLLALQFDFVPIFFSEIFPRLGVALAIILVILILLGLFMDPDKSWPGYFMFGIATIIIIVVLVQTAGYVGWYAGYFWYDNWPGIIGILIAVGLIVAVIASGGKRNGQGSPYRAVMFRKDSD